MAIPNAIKKTFNLPDGREISIETGKLAKQADGSVEVRMGDTMLLATVVSNQEAKEGVDFLPMSVDYQEKFASSGKIPGGFLKREGKLSDYEVLTSRLVDRALRPLFPSDYHSETQVFIQLFSLGEDDLPDSLAALAASAALTASDIPFDGPISEVRVARVNGEFIANPTAKQLAESDIDMIIAATIDNIMMVEGEMKEISEAEMVEAINFAHEVIKPQCQAQLELAKDAGKTEKREYNHEEEPNPELEKEIFDKHYQQFFDVAAKGLADKKERGRLFQEIKDSYLDAIPEESEISVSLAKKYLQETQKKAVRNATLETRSRLDGRKLDEIRPIWSEVDYLPSAHGSAVFTRGETQSITTVTLGTKLDEQMVDGAVHSGYNKFILHYNFPAFSTGEARPNRGPGRREVGHGNLALRALKQILPSPEELPYTIRVVSDILESNGSSSMATVCAGSLGLMDAGIPIKAPVSGIAMGLISDAETGKYAILSDILGDEDHIGDMDFKVTGTEKGITACQMDIKVDGLSSELMMEALNQAKAGRDHIRNEMLKTIAAPREDYKPNAPRVVNIEIDREMIGAVIGPGGKVVQEIQKTTGATVVIEETEKGGKINVFAVNKESLDQAVKWIKGIVAKPEVGEVYDGIVKAIQPYGAFVEIMPGKDGLLHISEIKHEKIDNLEGILEIGEEVKVKLIDIDKKTGKLRLSRKVLLPKPEKEEK
ncbi:MAG: polyribonucleotide nucleotidyltransferase [Bacteroidetes bacterium]|nr:MAG: polyribonucleotide nucleotidyltransferase [Bacteroidota bacterium]